MFNYYREIWASEKRWKDFRLGFITGISFLFGLLFMARFLLI